MKISELIKKLQEVQKEYGDVNVVIYDSINKSFWVRGDTLYIGG